MNVASQSMNRAFGDSGPQSDIARTLIPLLDALGWHGDEGYLFAALPHMRSDIGLVEMLNAMANLKFEGRLQQAKLADIDPRQMPCLFVPNRGGAMVLMGKVGKETLFFDGATSEYRQIETKNYIGQVAFFKPMGKNSDSFLKQQQDWFNRVVKRFSRAFVLGGVISGILTLLALLTPLFIMTIYDQLQSAASIEALSYLGIGVGLYIIADGGFRFLRSQLFNFNSVRLGNIIGNEVLRRILYLPPAYTETANLGAQVARIRDFETVREFLSGPAATALFELPFLIILVAGLFFIGGSLAWVPVVAIVVLVLFGVTVLPFMRRANTVAAQTGSERQEFILEAMTNLRTIKNVGATHKWLERFRELSANSAVATYSTKKVTAIINAFSNGLVMLSGLLTMALGVEMVMAGTISSGALMASMIMTWRILAPLRTGFSVMAQTGRIRRSIDQIDRLMNLRLESKQETALVNVLRLGGRVKFSNVAIRYSSDAAPALIGINFEAKPGEIVVILGHDGAGKTSILKLIMGLYIPQAGQVLLDNTNVRQMAPMSLRSAIGYSPQRDNFVYGTIAQNLRLSRPQAQQEEIEQACWKAQVLDDIMELPEGFETRIGDHNIDQLSISMRKRLNLARVFMREPKLVLLDEPETGMTDWEVDNQVASISMQKGDATMIVATHNLRFLDIADKVIWLERGRIRMMGTPAEVSEAFNKEHS